MHGRYILAIDMGSSNAKATLVSHSGELAGTGLQNIDTLRLPGGSAGQDPEQRWTSAMTAAKPAPVSAGVPVVCTTPWFDRLDAMYEL